MSTDSPAFAGRAGQTRRQPTTVLCGACDRRFGGAWLASLDADASPQLLAALLADGFATINTLTCPQCGWQHVAVEPLVVHIPHERRALLVLPGAQRHRVSQALLAHLAALGEDPAEGVPAYMERPEIVSGVEGMRAVLSASMAPASAARPSSKPVPFVAPADGEAGPANADAALVAATPSEAVSAEAAPAEAAPAEPARAEPPAADEPSASGEDQGLAPGVGDTVRPDPSSPAPEHDAPLAEAAAAASGWTLPPGDAEDAIESLRSDDVARVAAPPSVPAQGDLLSAVLGAGAPPPLQSPAEAATGEWADIDEAWSLAAPDAPPPPSDDEATHVVRVDEVGDRHPAGPSFDADRADARGLYVEVDGDAVRAVAQLVADRAARFETAPASLRFQLHQTAHGPVAGLLLVHEDAQGDAVDALFWPLDAGSPDGAAALRLLASVFAVDVVFHSVDGGFHGRRTLRAPLEANVVSAQARLAEAVDADLDAAVAVLTAPGYDLAGRLRHNFAEDSFEAITDAAEARLALGILSYWSAPERRDYLLRVRSFPEVWFDALTRRVLAAGLHFGLAMDPHLRQRCVELSLAAHPAQLLQQCMANFAEVNLNLRPSGLDPLDIWENWEALLTLAEELDLPVDVDIEDVAAQAMERARAVAHEVEDIDLDDDLSVEVEEVAELGEPDDQELVRQLSLPGRRLEAATMLLQRGQAASVGPIFNAMTRMTRDELLRLVPSVLAMGPSFEASLIVGLRSRRVSLRLSCALALGEIRSERAAAPMLLRLLSAGEGEWRVLARAVARIGRRILTPAARVVVERGDADGRVAHTLALLGAEARGALSAARAQAQDPRVDACFEQALAAIGKVGFGDPADFTERLLDGFAAAGEDDVPPDYEEDLASVDLGPSGSLEADVDLDDLDRPGQS